MKQKIINKILQATLVMLLVCSCVVLPFTGCVHYPKCFYYAAIWSCDYDDIKIEFTTTGFPKDIPLGTLTLDGETMEIAIGYVVSGGTIIIFRRDEYETALQNGLVTDAMFSIFLSTEIDKKGSLVLEVIIDNTKREEKESLVGREFVLTRSEIPIPTEVV